MRYIDKDLESIQELRNMLQNAQTSFVQLNELNQVELDLYSGRFIKAVCNDLSGLVSQYVEATNYGNTEDEFQLCSEFLQRFKETIQKETFVGMVEGDANDKFIEIGVPIGTVVVLLPTHPSFTLLVNLILLAVKSGNTFVFIANNKNKPEVLKMFRLLVDYIETTEYPKGCLLFVESVTDESIKELFVNSEVSLIINIDSPQYVNKKFRTNTPLIYGGGTSIPVFIDHTAEIEKAVEDVIHSRSFDNGILPGSEQFLVTEEAITDRIKALMESHGAYIMSSNDEKKLINFLTLSEKNIVDNYIGKSATWIAESSDIDVPKTTRLLVSVQNYMTDDNFFNRKLSCPILAIYMEPDWILACKKCMSILNELHLGHTLTIHSRDGEVIKEFAIQKAVGRMVVNAPTSCGATGITANFPPSLILGGGTTGRGNSVSNITPRELTYIRRVGFSLKD
ncbi:aldehyde dehydrogenase family protein [Lactococcus lactis]|uniref:aldehyde dehydrogenase family protein n=1 Tax=Lactococcus lactis TaxID=1358 RepID=UPI00293922B0|nr:aldehyde dehydrogenase family protein [Lactococcus lactis]MCU5753089.1 aldehyde dehydrogenase family protein [Lactococcus lactis]WOF40799.1 aldehyde dehydrogenase family protein [Lactococcus lactis]